ncbi:MAG TPA: TrbI/VirB10 family protein [Terriglobia bacterium]|nr:TrbI/VirB10 family protein [Terriglobia bacterium]
MTDDMESPTGINIYPDPPIAVRVKRAAGIFAFIVVAIILTIIIYAVCTRQQRQVQASSRTDTDRKAIPAMSASREFIDSGTALKAPQSETTPPITPPANRGIPSRALNSPRGPRTLIQSDVSDRLPRIADSERAGQGEDAVEMRAAQKELEAMEAPTAIGGSGRTFAPRVEQPVDGSPVGNSNPVIFNSSRLAAGSGLATMERPSNFSGTSPSAEYAAQNGQEDKRAFIREAQAHASQNYLQSVRTPPLSRFEIKAGWQIPAILEQAINSDQPGELRGFVRESVYDTATGRFLLIPQGSRLFGHYNSSISYAQDAVQVIWDRLIFPDGSSLNLDGMIGQDAAGAAGLRYSVDHHYARLLGFAVLTSLFSAGVQLSQNRNGTILAVPSNGQIVGSSVGGELSQLGAETFRRQLNVQPTIKIPAGYRFNVSVNRDIVFDAPYSPH